MRISNKWSEVSLKQYITITDIVSVDMDELDKQIKILSVLSNITEDKICQMNLSDLKEAIRHCQFIFTPPRSGHIKQYIRIGRHKFSINTNLKTITGGEYIDLTGFIKDKLEITQNLPKIISIFLNPVNFFGFRKKKYFLNGIQTLDSRERTAKIIEDKLMMNEVMALSGFFLNNWKALTKAILNYSELEMMKTKMNLEKIIAEDSKIIGVGI